MLPICWYRGVLGGCAGGALAGLGVAFWVLQALRLAIAIPVAVLVLAVRVGEAVPRLVIGLLAAAAATLWKTIEAVVSSVRGI